jgi:hypothetical protein
MLNMPQKVSCKPGSCPGEIIVSWNAFESEKLWQMYQINRLGRIVLHRESACAKKKVELLASRIDSKSSHSPMGLGIEIATSILR